jgi:tRNA 2-selenouridine synthase
VAIQRLLIHDFLERSSGKLLLDVRSPGEYQHAHIPGAHSLPLFTDEERKVVGTTYKQQSREQAIKVGLDYFGPKMRKMVEEVEEMLSSKLKVQSSKSEVSSRQSVVGSQESSSEFKVQRSKSEKSSEFRVQRSKEENPEQELRRNSESETRNPKSETPEVYVYCWRGGMRSAGVAWLLDLYGFKVFTLSGGYKAFRNYVLQTFEQPFDFKILGGFTGSGKTEIIKELEKRGEAVIDLERIAAHRGSAFGGFKMPPQSTQEMFENKLALQLLSLTKKKDNPASLTAPPSIWLEDESQRIGNLNIPSALWKTMRQSPVFFLEIPFEERLDNLVKEYGECDREKLCDSVRRISQRLGGLDTKNTLNFLEEGNIKEAFRILLKYYDKYYLKGLHNRENLSALLTKMSCTQVTVDNVQKLPKYLFA